MDDGLLTRFRTSVLFFSLGIVEMKIKMEVQSLNGTFLVIE